MGGPAIGRTWESASTIEAGRLAHQFESAWRASTGGDRPDPLHFLPDDETRPGARLALLRTDLTLRREAGETARVEDYVQSVPDLDEDTLIGLIYEEFCLREEEFDRPEQAEYIERFPALAARIRRVLGIHDLVGSGQSTAFHQAFAPPDMAMPGVGETIAGFRLVRELGRGTFARVFLAEELALGDRSVALKVSRAASREPQALARLQHTHIVPIHSYQTDPETGLHLLCMPYFGRVTLGQLLEDSKVQAAQDGSEIVSAIDRLDPAGSLISDRPAGRIAMARRPYARAMAWWGARLAEALQHAHDRGVLHRDIKPSNVLITGDGLPMLLDFNLAREDCLLESGEPAGILGGTIAYMAPEHLEALTLGENGRIDGRTDVYSLGVVLHEALDARPFQAPTAAASLDDALARSLAQRSVAPRLNDDRVEIPPELRIVVRKCLAPEPADRYARPSELAEDLQAVADDLPLRHAREPVLGRSIRWVRRHKRPLAALLLAILSVLLATLPYINARKALERRRAEVLELLHQGEQASDDRKMELAVAFYQSAVKQAQSIPDLSTEAAQARKRLHLARQIKDRLDAADAIHAKIDGLRLRLLHFVPSADLDSIVKTALAPFHVLDDRASMPEKREWFELEGISLLDPDRRNRLFHDVDEILFLWALSIDARPLEGLPSANLGKKLCEHGLKASIDPLVTESEAGANPISWRALLGRFNARIADRPPTYPVIPPDEKAAASECYRWGLIQKQLGQPSRAIEWLQRAARKDPSDYWYAFYLAHTLEKSGSREEAQTYYSIAIALRRSMPWAYLNRALIYRSRGAWDQALADLRAARDLGLASQASPRDVDARDYEEAYVQRKLSESARARAVYSQLAGRPGVYQRAARTSLASMDAEEGENDRAFAEYDRLLAESPSDSTARLARAILSYQLGRFSAAELDLNFLLQEPANTDGTTDPEQIAAAHYYRGLVRLELNWSTGAIEDAELAWAASPSPAIDRLRLRADLAAGRFDLPGVVGPESFELLPKSGPTLKVDLRAAADRLRIPDSTELHASEISTLLVRASILEFLSDPDALTVANRAVSIAPGSSSAHLLRAKVLRNRKARESALEDVKEVQKLDPRDPRAFELRGRIQLESGNAEAARLDFDRAIDLGDNGSTRSARAESLAVLGRHSESIDDWTRALRADPEDPRLFLGRAREFLALKRWEKALADLESAVAWSSNRPDFMTTIADLYARCVPHRPGRAARGIELRRLANAAGLR